MKTPASSPGSSADDRLRDIRSITDATLSELDDQDFLAELLDRTRAVLQADTATVLLLDPAARQLIATAARGLEDEVRQGVRIPVGAGFAGRIAAEGRPVIIDHVDHSNVRNPVLLSAGIRSLIGVPLLARGAVIGVLHVGSLTDRRFTGQDTELLQLAAERAAVALQSQLTRADRMAAVALQRSLLPSALPSLPGTEMAARYVPGGGPVGGDWYDVFTLPSGELGVVIGDVAGSGLRAAVIMGRMRSALRAYALEAGDPADVLGRLDRKMQHFEPGALATVLYAIFDPGLSRVRISSAGHFPPVVAFPGQPAVLAEVAPDLLIGVDPGVRRQSSALELPPGALICFYTDGLVERRDRPIDDGLELLRQVVEPEPPDAACASVMGALAGGEPPGDDIALLVLRREPAGAAPGGTASGIGVHRTGSLAFASLPGEIDTTNAPRINQELVSLVDSGPGTLIADLTQTTFCDSSGAAALVRIAKRAQAGGVSFRVAASPAVMRVLGLLGADRLLDVYPGIDAAISGPPAPGRGHPAGTGAAPGG
jgi:anti-anti-sigma factor